MTIDPYLVQILDSEGPLIGCVPQEGMGGGSCLCATAEGTDTSEDTYRWGM
jgi:hypothetical protein